jgi:hypothetical protein
VTVGPLARQDRTQAEARVAGLLGVLGLGVAIWLDTWADGEVAHVAFLIWAAFGIGVFTAGIITQCGRIRHERAGSRQRAVASGARGTSHNEEIAASPGSRPLVPAPRQESPHGVTAAQEVHATGSRAGR